MKFEYKLVDYKVDVAWLGGHKLEGLEKQLDREGKDGWEAVGFTHRANSKEAFYTVLLKRAV
jgi:hypothetical protein